MSDLPTNRKDNKETGSRNIIDSVRQRIGDLFEALNNLSPEVLEILNNALGQLGDSPTAEVTLELLEGNQICFSAKNLDLPKGKSKIISISLLSDKKIDLKILQGLERNLSLLFSTGGASMKGFEENIIDTAGYLAGIDAQGYEAIIVQAAYRHQDLHKVGNLHETGPFSAKIILQPASHRPPILFSLDTLQNQNSGHSLNQAQNRFFSYIINKIKLQQEANNQILLQNALKFNGEAKKVIN